MAVGPTPPADWGTRSTRSHLGKRPEHEIPDFCSRRGGPGGAPYRSGPGLPERGWGPRAKGSTNALQRRQSCPRVAHRLADLFMLIYYRWPVTSPTGPQAMHAVYLQTPLVTSNCHKPIYL
jgi:hypothetical protein